MPSSPGVEVTPDASVAGQISVKIPGGSFAVFATSDISTAVSDIIAVPADCPEVYYNLQGIEVDNPAPGSLYIVRRGNSTVKEIAR